MISVPRVRWRLVLHILLGAVLYRFISHIWFPQFTSPMSSSTSPADVAAALLAEEGLQLQSLKVLQSLWAGYGHICHITATQQSKNPSAETSRSTSAANSNVSTPQETQSFILKLIRPPPTKANDEGHTRKILSYQVEQYFYTHLAPQMPASLPVAKCLASINEHHANGSTTTAMILTDLRQEFPIPGEKREALTPVQAHAALDWLSGFHGFWWPRVKDLNRSSLVRPPLEEVQHDGQSATKKTIWLNGGYTYLATRRTEYAALSSDHTSEWSQPLTDWEDGTNSLSELIAAFLAPTTTGWSPTSGYQTLIHGDVKSENLFTSVSGEAVAFYDFQYVGLGLGVSDLAKFFTCSVPLHMLVSDVNNIPQVLAMQQPEKELLQRYWARLKDVSKREYEWGVFVRHWETALVDWLRFQAGWGFWGNTEWLEARVRSVLKDEGWREGLVGNVRTLDLPEKDF